MASIIGVPPETHDNIMAMGTRGRYVFCHSRPCTYLAACSTLIVSDEALQSETFLSCLKLQGVCRKMRIVLYNNYRSSGCVSIRARVRFVLPSLLP